MRAESALSTGGHSPYLESSGRGVSLALQWEWPASGKGQGQPRRAGPGQLSSKASSPVLMDQGQVTALAP